jgi:hypothetical protein
VALKYQIWPKPAERHLARIHALPCVICLNCKGERVNAAEAHHLEAYRGEHSAWATVPLCKACHSLLHTMHRKPFYALYNIDDTKLLAWTIKLLTEGG